MQHRALQNSEIKLSEIGLGCASYWGKKHFSEKRAIDVVHQAIEAGVNYFDTGHSYSGGHAEIRLGKALKNKINSEHLIISSKVGTRVGNFGRLYKDFSAAWIKQSCEQSLQQLQTDHLPIYFLHGPNPEDFNSTTYQALDVLKQQGKIGLFGVNTFDDEIIQMAEQSGQFQTVMLDFNIYKPHRMALIKQLKAAGQDVFIAGALAGAIYDQRFWRFQGLKSFWYWVRAWKNNPQLSTMKKAMQCLNDVPNLNATQVALAYVLHHTEISTALIGSTQVGHLLELLAATSIDLDEGLIKKIESQAEKIDYL